MLRMTLLDGFSLECDGEPVALCQSAQRLLAVLAVLHGTRRVRRSTVAERLWPDVPAAKGTASLRSVLWRLPRPRSRTLVVGTAGELRFSADIEVDFWRAESLTKVLCRPDPPEVDVAELSALRCDLLPDWDEAWLAPFQVNFRQRRLHALEEVAARLCREGRFTDALEAGLGAVTGEPLRETAHARVIEVHLAEGNHAEALRQYDGYRRLLADELGLLPSPRIDGLVEPLLDRSCAGRSKQRRPARHHLTTRKREA